MTPTNTTRYGGEIELVEHGAGRREPRNVECGDRPAGPGIPQARGDRHERGGRGHSVDRAPIGSQYPARSSLIPWATMSTRQPSDTSDVTRCTAAARATFHRRRPAAKFRRTVRHAASSHSQSGVGNAKADQQVPTEAVKRAADSAVRRTNRAKMPIDQRKTKYSTPKAAA